MTNPNVLHTMDVLNEIIVPAHYCDHNLPPLIICRMVNLSLEHGNSDGSCVAWQLQQHSIGIWSARL